MILKKGFWVSIFTFCSCIAPVLVQVLQGAHELRRNAPHLSLGQLPCSNVSKTQAECGYKTGMQARTAQRAVVLEYLKQLPVRVFRNDAKLSFGFEVLYHLDDVGVGEGGQDADLLAQALQVLLRLAVLWDELHSDGLGRALAAALEHLAEGAFAYLLENVVVVHGGGAARWLAGVGVMIRGALVEVD
jgi:hypothetical protein